MSVVCHFQADGARGRPRGPLFRGRISGSGLTPILSCHVTVTEVVEVVQLTVVLALVHHCLVGGLRGLDAITVRAQLHG